MSILNVNQIQPVGGGNTITVNASDVSASGVTITASSFVGPVTGNVTGNLTGNVTGNISGGTVAGSTGTFTNEINTAGVSASLIINRTIGGSAVAIKVQNSGSDVFRVENDGSATFAGDVNIADKIVHTGDTNTAIRFPASDTITAETGGTERLRITSAGISQFTSDSNTRVATFTGNGVEINHSLGSNIFIGTQAGADGKMGTVNNANMSLFTNNSYAKRVELQTSGNLSIADGNLVVASGHGIDFSAAGNAGGMQSELLDDYEEGTWTPTSETGTISTTSATYTKIGNIVHLNAYIDTWSNTTSDAVVQIQSLPFNGENTDANVGSVMYRYIDDTDGVGGDLALFMANGTSLRFYFQNSDGDSNYSALKHKDINGNSSSFRIQITYRAA